jgi:hypothetical protein
MAYDLRNRTYDHLVVGVWSEVIVQLDIQLAIPKSHKRCQALLYLVSSSSIPRSKTLIALLHLLRYHGISWTKSPKTPAQRLRELLANPNEIIVAPGVHDGISARIAPSLGFDALYMVGSIDLMRVNQS